MKTINKIAITLCILLAYCAGAQAQTDFVLDPLQSMIMTGKGKGQDGTINPYFGETCYAIVQNIGDLPFSIRLQKKGTIIREIAIQKGELKKIKLLKDYELYLDPNPNGKAKARVDYQKLED